MGLLAVMTIAAGPSARAVAYDDVRVRVLDPPRRPVVCRRARRRPSEPAGTAQVTFGTTVVTITKGTATEPSMGTLIDHIGLSYRDLDAAVKKAEAAGAKVTSAPRESPGIFRYAYIEDPWGVRIEMVQDTERIGFHHVHLRVKDPDATLAWYEAHFGGERTKLRGKLDGLRFDGVWLFAMSSGADGPAPPAAIQLVAFRVDDVDAGIKGLTAAGVKTAVEPRTIPALRYALVEDPNGIRVELVKRSVTP